MELKYTTKDGRMTVTIEGRTQKDLWRELSKFQEVFEETARCKQKDKVIESNDIRYRVRQGKYTDDSGKEKTAEYFEKVVLSGPMRGYKKAYGVLDDGTDNLFPKRKVPENSVPGFDGWHKWIKQDNNKQESNNEESKKDEEVPF